MKRIALCSIAAAFLAQFALASDAPPTQSSGGGNPIDLTVRSTENLLYTEAALDEGSRKVLDMIAAQAAPPPWTLPPVQVRKAFEGIFRQFSLPDPHLATCELLEIVGPDGPIPISIFRPNGAGETQLAVLVYYHGGGMMANDTDTYSPAIPKRLPSGTVRIST